MGQVMGTHKHPLEDIRVVDLGRNQAAPRCAQVLARMGAEVIKVERLGGDETRYSGPKVRKQSAYWVQYNTGKKSLSLDLRTEKGKEILRQLVKVSDVVVQNFRPGVIETMGFGYDTLKEMNPRIIMVNISAYGQFGPHRDKIGMDPIGQAMSGIAMVTGEEGMPPIRAGVPIIDRITALHSAIGTLAAIYERETSGLGQSIDVCLADTGYSLTEIPISAYHHNKVPPKRGGYIKDENYSGGDRSGAFGGFYPCKDGWVLLSAGNAQHWPRVCDALGKPEWLEDPRFATREQRAAHSELVNQALRDLLAGLTMDKAVVHFTKHDVIAAPANTIPEAEAESHPWERGAMMEVPDFLAGTIAVSGDYWHFSRTPAVVGSAPQVGEHNEEILCAMLGYSKDELAQLREEGVVGESHRYDEVPG